MLSGHNWPIMQPSVVKLTNCHGLVSETPQICSMRDLMDLRNHILWFFFFNQYSHLLSYYDNSPKCEEYFTKYCESHWTLLWIWIMLWFLITKDFALFRRVLSHIRKVLSLDIYESIYITLHVTYILLVRGFGEDLKANNIKTHG